MQELVLSSGQLQARVLPQIGAGLARLDYLRGGQALPLLRPWTGGELAPRPNQLACSVLLPWSNRIAGGFAVEGRHYPIAPNRVGEQYAIHGEGSTRPWQVLAQSANHAELGLDRSDGAPFCYQARVVYRLEAASMVVTLTLQNVGAVTLPFGLGLHPWMPRTAAATLQARARKVWLAGDDKLPRERVEIPAHWSFEQERGVPGDAVDNVFEGWDGKAAVSWPETGLRLSLEADCRYYIVYAPVGADFFCIEPVDHLINAHNAAGGPQHNGLTLLAPGQQLSRTFRFSVAELITSAD